MAEETIVMCHICEERKANAKCFLCDKYICGKHNFGGKHSEIGISAVVYNIHVFSIEIEDKFMDCCPYCANILRRIMNKKGEILKNKLIMDLKNIKLFLLEEIKKKNNGGSDLK